MKNVVRIQKIELTNFKNTINGVVTMPSSSKVDFEYGADILGIYGQNGTGKTAIIDSMIIIQTLLFGFSLPSETRDYITKNKKNCSIETTFLVEAKNCKARVEYVVSLEIVKDSFSISNEKLNIALWNGTSFDRKKDILEYTMKKPSQFFPSTMYNSLIKKQKDKINVGVLLGLSQKEKKSAIFSDDNFNFFCSRLKHTHENYVHIISALKVYPRSDLFIVTNQHSSIINSLTGIPLFFRERHDDTVSMGAFPLRLDGPYLVDSEDYATIETIINRINLVIPFIIPNLQLEIKNLGQEINNQGDETLKIQALSKRNDVSIPTRYESSGIIKIISILNALIYTYNNSSACLIADELDAGIFEYLLGELLEIFEGSAKGQIIFTSHNLRPLEIIKKTSIIFSTTNPSNRYIRIQGAKNNNNLRDLYLRSIVLGGQNEGLYMETDSVSISRAFRKAGKAVCSHAK